jgi:hypothetical protein
MTKWSNMPAATLNFFHSRVNSCTRSLFPPMKNNPQKSGTAEENPAGRISERVLEPAKQTG